MKYLVDVKRVQTVVRVEVEAETKQAALDTALDLVGAGDGDAREPDQRLEAVLVKAAK